ncbi:MAG: hypothetical protein Q7R71_02385 [bacterium]|nr:hypothetical protein [bacterium]
MPLAGNYFNMQEKNTLMGVLCYLGPLVIVSYIVAKDDPFVKFHIKQGLVLLVIELVVYAIGMFMWQFWPLYQIINLATFILSIVGIVNVVQGYEKELPIVGSFGQSFKI